MRWLLLALLLAGCAAMANTPAQDRTWVAYAACQAEGRVANNISIYRVEASGRYWYRTGDGSYGMQALRECMEEKFGRRPAPPPR